VNFLIKTAFYTVVGLVILFGLKSIYTKWQDRTLDVRQHVAWVRDLARDGAREAKEFVVDRAPIPDREPARPKLLDHRIVEEETLGNAVGPSEIPSADNGIAQDHVIHVHSRVADNISCLMKAQSTLMRDSEAGNE